MKKWIKEKDSCTFDAVALGEVMLRLDPGDERIGTAREFRAWEGGGEYNVIRALSTVFDLKTAVVTAFADNDVGTLLKGFIRLGGVNTDYINFVPCDGICKNIRNGLNFSERGFGVRSAKGVSDRANSAASQMKPGDINWDKLFSAGVRWFHTGGIFTALSDTCADITLEAVKAAKKHGTAVSFDFNYRPSLWEACENKAHLKEVTAEILKYTDVVFASEFDLERMLDYSFTDSLPSEPDEKCYTMYMSKLFNQYPNIKLSLTTRRTVKSAGSNAWDAWGFSREKGIVKSPVSFPDLQILDRIGGGDGFASGAIWALMCNKTETEALGYGVCHGALAMTTPGDNSMAAFTEIEKLINGESSSVTR